MQLGCDTVQVSNSISKVPLALCRYLLRLGMGEQELATEMDFSRVGRVNAMLARRLELLAEVQLHKPKELRQNCSNQCALDVVDELHAGEGSAYPAELLHDNQQ